MGPAMRTRVMKLGLIVLIVLACIGCDQAAKHAARQHLEGRGTVSLVDGVVQLRYVENSGAFLSLGSTMPRPVRMVAFIAFPLIVLALMIVYVARRRETAWLVVAGLSFIVGGGCGNLIDRVLHDGRVSDFIIVGIGFIHTGILNLADLSVLLGCILLLLSPKKKPPRPGVDAPGA
jgi:signal peptidase II